jgi:hypothetical protein
MVITMLMQIYYQLHQRLRSVSNRRFAGLLRTLFDLKLRLLETGNLKLDLIYLVVSLLHAK